MKRSFVIIFTINMVLRVFMQGLLPLYPIITEKLGASRQSNGIILASSYTMLLVSTWLSGKLVPRYTNAKSLLLISMVPMCIGMGLLGTATTITSFVLYSLVLFFSAGMNIIAGIMLISHFSSADTVGKNFGIIGLSNLLGSLIGGFVVGPALFNLGYFNGFLLFAAILFIVCLFTFFVQKPEGKIIIEAKHTFRFSKNFIFVLLSFVLAVMLIHVFLFSFSLSVKAAGYNISDISIFSAIGTALTLPIPYLLGKWTTIYLPKNLLLLVYALMGIALILLLLPKYTPIIILAVACMSVLAYAGRAIIVALVFPWYDAKDMPLVQAYMGIAAWLAAIVGYLFSGFSLQHLGFTYTVSIGIVIAFVAIGILGKGVKTTTAITNGRSSNVFS